MTHFAVSEEMVGVGAAIKNTVETEIEIPAAIGLLTMWLAAGDGVQL